MDGSGQAPSRAGCRVSSDSMPNLSASKDQPERKLTDQSLRIEREKTDRALADSQAAVEDDADVVVQRARHNADAVLEMARGKADQLAEAPEEDVAVAYERALADETLRGERASADELLRRERDHVQLLAKLLPLERDQTDRYLLTERLRSDDAVSHRDDFLSIVSHDLRNLLAGIVFSTTMLAKAGTAGAEGEATLGAAGRIQRYAARMNRLIGDLLDVGSIDAGHLAVTLAPGDLGAVVREALDTFRSSAEARGLSLEIEHLDAPLLADFDHGRILQVFANLISNAVKFTAPGGRIGVRCVRAGGVAEFVIADTGTGIPAGMLESVFERFWQVGKNDRRGLGLGLYISRCIIEAHGGKIWAESTPGQGARFHFTLPAAG